LIEALLFPTIVCIVTVVPVGVPVEQYLRRGVDASARAHWDLARHSKHLKTNICTRRAPSRRQIISRSCSPIGAAAMSARLEHIQFLWKLNMRKLLAFVAFSDGKPVSTPDQVRGRPFPENALARCLQRVVDREHHCRSRRVESRAWNLALGISNDVK
jgi:hypothetical protein